MEDEQKEILDGVIVDISKFSFEKRKELLSFSEKITEKFPGDKPLRSFHTRGSFTYRYM